jgi:hypothetical protein
MIGSPYGRNKTSGVYKLDMMGVGDAEANSCRR